MRKIPFTGIELCADSCQVTACGCRSACISKNEERLNEGPRLLQSKQKDENETKQTRSTVLAKDDLTSANQTPGEDKSSCRLWLVNYGKRTSTSPLALGCALLGPSRHVRAYYLLHAVVQQPLLNVESYKFGTLPSQVPIWEMEHESTAEINSLLSTEIPGSWRASIVEVVKVKTKIILGKLFCYRY